MKYDKLLSRLTDPDECVSEFELRTLSRKISKAMVGLAAKPENGGNPFLFSFIGTKPHELATSLPMKHCKFTTCASNGKKFYWHPDFLGKLDSLQVQVCMAHEAWHVALDHLKRSVGKDPAVWNIAIDYIANAIIENDWRNTEFAKRYGDSPWGGILGNPMPLKRLISFLKGGELLPTDRLVFSDISVLNKTPEWIYEQIKEVWDDSSRSKQYGPNSQVSALVSVDTHVSPEIGKDELDEELTTAAKTAESMEPGSVPFFIKEYLKKLHEPSLDFMELVRSCLFFKQNNDGMQNNWKRPRKRGLSIGTYLPSRYTFKPKWLCLLDTSRSMSKEDIERGVSQLKTLGDETDGFVVPCDAEVHWDSVKKIESADELDQVEAVGRGGTIFDSFFAQYEEKLGSDFDVIIVITDGLVKAPPFCLQPPSDVIWAITKRGTFNPEFGKVIKF